MVSSTHVSGTQLSDDSDFERLLRRSLLPFLIDLTEALQNGNETMKFSEKSKVFYESQFHVIHCTLSGER